MLKFIKGVFSLGFHLIMVVFLTLSSQVGGIIWAAVFLLYKIIRPKAPFFIPLAYTISLYIVSVIFIIPPLALKYGKKQLPTSQKGNLIAHNPSYFLLNRNYVTPEMFDILIETADRINAKNSDLKLVYLDTSFPFSKEMPLPPHISHSSGNKVDLTYVYRKNGKIVNHGSSISGYGNFEGPKSGEFDQPKNCLERGKYFYDFSKYFSLGAKKDLEFDAENTRLILEELLSNHETRRIYLETHLKNRMNINDERVSSAGCWAVRHDDHIHFQINRNRR